MRVSVAWPEAEAETRNWADVVADTASVTSMTPRSTSRRGTLYNLLAGGLCNGRSRGSRASARIAALCR